MIINECHPRSNQPGRGMTSVEAAQFLHEQLPEVKSWLFWEPRYLTSFKGLRRIPAGEHDAGNARDHRRRCA